MSLKAHDPEEKRPLSTLVILGVIVFAAALATLIVPRGEYQRVVKDFPKLVAHTIRAEESLTSLSREVGAPNDLTLSEVLDAGTRAPVTSLTAGQRVLVSTPGLQRTTIVPGTYQPLDAADTPGIWKRTVAALRSVALAPIRGFVLRAEVIAFVLLIGGAFGVILATGALDRALARVVTRMGDGRLRKLVIPVSMILFSLGGAIFGMGESTIAFVLITIPLSIRLGYDTVTGVCMCYLATQIGFAGAFFNPFTVGIAQSIAELPHLSGLGFRLIAWTLVTALGISFVALWAKRVRADPSRSPTRALDQYWRTRLEAGADEAQGALRLSEYGVVLTVIAVLLLSGVGVAMWGWYIQEMAALFVVAGIAGGLLGGFRPGRVAQEFTTGAASMIEPVLVIALSAGVLGVLQDGQVLDTFLSGLAAPLDVLPRPVGAVLIMGGQAVINFFVPSGSGQAAMTMPVMTPLCDILGVQRQVGVLAFQFGDGFGNTMIPTSAVLMGVLGAARVPWTTWVRWVWPLILMLHLLGAALLVVAIYGPVGWMEWPT
ncbi:MAG: putative ion transporter superfamily protein YfcC [Planctomycetota bacterium]